MSISIVKERLSILTKACRTNVLKAKGVWTLEPQQLRFAIGDAHGELKVPFVFGSSDLRVFKTSLMELAFYVKNRMEDKSPEELEKLFASKLPGRIRELPAPSYRLLSFDRLPLSNNTIHSLLYYVPILDMGVLKVWLGQKGAGRVLFENLTAIYKKSLKEEIYLEAKERTAFITHLAVTASLDSAKDVIKRIGIRGIGYEKWEYYIGLILYLILKEAIQGAISMVKEELPLADIDSTCFLLRSLITPINFVFIKKEFLKYRFNPYSISHDIFETLYRLDKCDCTEMDEPEQMIESLCEKAGKDKGINELIILESKLRTFKTQLLIYIASFDDHQVKEHKFLVQFLRDEKSLLKIFLEEEANKEVCKAIDILKESFPNEKNRLSVLEKMHKAATLNKRWFKGRRTKQVPSESNIRDAVKGYLAYRFDQVMDERLSFLCKLMKNRREDFVEDEIMEDYTKGRIYRFSADTRSILKGSSSSEEGYLFIDMKDFTRKTFRTKEIAMADFMKAKFFNPIIEVASKYGLGKDITEEAIGVKLKNLLGDAIIFSGTVSSLVYLAEDIQAIMDIYRRELAEKLTPQLVRKMADELKASYGKLKKSISSKKAATQGRDIIDLMDEEGGLESAYRDDIEEMKKKEMMSGLYISYGAMAEEVYLRNDLWGEINVTIGEKINEAARGVGRSGLVKARLDSILEQKRVELKKPYLTLPFSVYIGRTYRIVIDFPTAAKIENALIKKGLEDSKNIAGHVANTVYADLKKAVVGGSFTSLEFLKPVKDIYNIGQALSGRALKAFRRETKATTLHFNKKIPVKELAEEIKERFFFFEDVLNFWFSIRRSFKGEEILVFRHVGNLTFRGFEPGGSTTVYEIIKKDSDFYKLFFKYHLNKWIDRTFMKAPSSRGLH